MVLPEGKAINPELESDRDHPMIAKLKYKHHQDKPDGGNREHRRREKALDEALKNTFPASDPVSVEQPMLPAADGNADEGNGNSSA